MVNSFFYEIPIKKEIFMIEAHLPTDYNDDTQTGLHYPLLAKEKKNLNLALMNNSSSW